MGDGRAYAVIRRPLGHHAIPAHRPRSGYLALITHPPPRAGWLLTHHSSLITHHQSLIANPSPLLVLATRNAGKLAELRARLVSLPVELVAAGDLGAPEVQEVADTLAGNAHLKAESLHAFTGLPSLADDTGLEVDALGGRPGVRSARYAGPESDDSANRARLLAELDGVPPAGRSARFRAVLAYVDDAGSHLFEGTCEGRITTAEKGTGGFGYDPIFVPDDQPEWIPPDHAGAERTFSQMTREEKNLISHRGRALDAFVAFLEGEMGG